MDSTQEKNLEEGAISKGIGYHFLETRSERFVFLALLTLVSAAPIIFRDSLPAHADWHSHAANAYHFKRCFWQGEWYPRWLDALMYGYGVPKFNYYAPLFYYLYIVLDLIFRNAFLSMKWLIVLTMVLSTIFGYLYLRKHGSKVATSIAMIFVIFSPAVHIYTYNNNFPTNTLAIPFVFLTLLVIDTFNKEKEFDIKSFLITSCGYALTILSHLATAFMLSLLLVPYFFLNLWIYRTKRFVKNFFLSIGFGAALSAFYLIPAVMETNLVHTEIISRGRGWDYSANFMFTYLDRLPSDGYYWGIFDHHYYEASTALYSLVTLICLVILLVNKDKLKSYLNEPFRVTIAIIMLLISFLMTTPISIFIWIMIKQMKTLQFPWRFVSFIVPFGAVVMVYTFDLISRTAKEKIDFSGYRFLSWSMAGLFAVLFYVNFVNIFRWYWTPAENFVRHSMYVVWQNREYQPNLTGDPNWEQLDYGRDFSPSLLSTNPTCDFSIVKWLSHDRIFQVFSDVEHQLRIRTFVFPGWNTYIDGRPTNILMDPKTGAMIIQVPAGKHEIRVSFELTPIRKIATYITLGSFVLFVLLFLKLFKKSERKIEIVKDENQKKESEVTESKPQEAPVI